MKRIKILPLLIIVLFLSSGNAREWKAVSAKYSIVEYPVGLETIADSLLKIAEITIPRMSEMADLPLSSFDEEKVRIILIDVLDLSNGFALENTVVILTLSSDYIPAWSGTKNWYEQVLTHELAHLVTFRKLRRKANFFGNIFFITTPRWFWEGIAQYFSESWNAYRGDLYVKNALFDGKLNSSSLNSDDGRLLYGTAHAFTRYLASQYGDSSLIKIMSYNESGLFYDFHDAFKSVYGKSVNQMFPFFVKHLVLYYGDKYSDYPILDYSKPIPSFGYSTDQVLPLFEEDSTYLVSARQNENHLYKSAYIAKIKNNRSLQKRIISNDFHTPLVLNKKQNLIAFGRYNLDYLDNLPSLNFNWYVYDRNKDSKKKVAEDIHARHATFDSGDNLIVIEITSERSILYKIDVGSGSKTKIFETDIPLGKIEFLSDNKYLLDGQQKNGNRDVFLLSNNELIPLTNDSIDDRTPVSFNDSIFIFNRYIDNNPALAVFNLKTKKYQTVANCLNEYWIESVDTLSNSIILSHWDPGRKTKYLSVPSDSLMKKEMVLPVQINNTRYANWINFKPDRSLLTLADTTISINERQKVIFPQFPLMHGMTIALPSYDQEYGYGIYGLTAWYEMLQRQALSSTFYFFPENPDKSLFFINHFIRFYNLNLTSLYYHGPVFFRNDELEDVELIRDIVAFDIGRLYYIEGNHRLTFYPSVGLSWNRQKVDYGSAEYKLNYHTVRTGGYFNYHLPTRLYPFIAKREVGFYTYIHQSLTKEFNFQVQEIGGCLATNLFIETLGIKSEGTYLKQRGDRIPFRAIGVDRFFETNIPRDFGFTRPVRGVREDISGDELWWCSNELNFLLLKNTSLKLLFLPLNNIAIGGFFDYANVISGNDKEVYSYGSEFTFGPTFMRLGIGYARAKLSDDKISEEIYFRIRIDLPGVYNSNKNHNQFLDRRDIYLD